LESALIGIQAQFRIRLEEPKAVGVIREAVEKVERCRGVIQGEGRDKRRQRSRGRNQENERYETLLDRLKLKKKEAKKQGKAW
jgi:hypothetical protein